MAWALSFLALTARELHHGRRGWLVVLLMIGCLGLLVRGHQLITDLALLAGVATGMYGLARSRRSPIVGGLALGVGGAIAFLSKGLLGPGFLGLTALALTAFPAWRHRTYLRALCLASIVGLPGIAVWALALYRRSPDLFHEWLVLNNFGRFFGFSNLGPTPTVAGFYVQTLLWHAFPALPLAAWTAWDAWRRRSGAWNDPTLQLPATMFVAMLTVLTVAHDARELYLMPALLPLALLAAAGVEHLPNRAARSVERVVILSTIAVATVLWSGWLMLITGRPEAFQRLVAKLQPGFVPGVAWPAVAVALLVTILWLHLVRGRQQSMSRSVVSWAAGITLCWTLVGTLWLPLLDAHKSYRAMIASLAQMVPEDGCIASRHLGEPQRALLEYFAGIVTLREETVPTPICNALLVQGRQDSGAFAPDFPGVAVWEGARPGDRKEFYRLYVRGAPSNLAPQRFPAFDTASEGASTPLLGTVPRSLRRLMPANGKARSSPASLPD
jgi:4-amino-4-deoxy-L-arabinose transferase-like glycosyltransferase